MVFLGLTTIWSLATPPTRRSPFSESATTEGRIKLPLSVGTTLGTLLRTNATQVFVVPRSIPTMRGLSGVAILHFLYHPLRRGRNVVARGQGADFSRA